MKCTSIECDSCSSCLGCVALPEPYNEGLSPEAILDLVGIGNDRMADSSLRGEELLKRLFGDEFELSIRSSPDCKECSDCSSCIGCRKYITIFCVCLFSVEVAIVTFCRVAGLSHSLSLTHSHSLVRIVYRTSLQLAAKMKHVPSAKSNAVPALKMVALLFRSLMAVKGSVLGKCWRSLVV